MIRKSRKSMQKPSINIPGKALLKYVKYGLPKISGVYFVYYKTKDPGAMSSTFPAALTTKCVFNKGKWISNKQILAFIGPLPVLTLDEIEEGYKKEDLSLHVYCTGTLKNAMQGKWKEGPFQDDISPLCSKGEKGDYVFEVNQRTTIPVPINFYSEKAGKWLKVKNTNLTIQKMKKLNKEGKKRTKSSKTTESSKAKTHYVVCTVPQMHKGGFSVVQNIIGAFGQLAEKGEYIFEISEERVLPVYQWKNGWKNLSNKKVRAIRKRIGDL